MVGDYREQTVKLTKYQINCARDWIKDCTWRDINDEEEIDGMSDEEIIDGIKRHYAGGLRAFISDCNEQCKLT